MPSPTAQFGLVTSLKFTFEIWLDILSTRFGLHELYSGLKKTGGDDENGCYQF